MNFSRLKTTLFILPLLVWSVFAAFLLPHHVFASESKVRIFCDNPENTSNPANQIGPWYNQGLCQFADKVFEETNETEMFGERYSYAQVNWIVNSLTIMAINETLGAVETTTSQAILGQTPTPNNSLLAGNYFFPLSGIKELQTFFDRITFVTPASAQTGGYGFSQLEGIRALWSATRNSAYLLMVVLLVVSGFLIMFRVKINPQTAVTIQSTIPKVILTLVLVTFSYAIAGFLIDLTFVVLGFTIYLLSIAAPNIITDPNTVFSTLSGPTLWGVFGLFVVIAFYYAGSIFGLAGPIVGLILVIILAVLLLKVFVMLLKSYIYLILRIVVGPWQIMLGILPNQSGFSGWIKGVVGELAVFVVVPLMFLFTLILWAPTLTLLDAIRNIFTGNFGAIIGALFLPIMSGISPIPPTATLPNLPLFSSAGDLLRLFMGYGLIALTPKAADLVREVFKTPPFKYGSAFTEALGPVGFAAGYLANRADTEQAMVGKNMSDQERRDVREFSMISSMLKGIQNRTRGR